MSDRLGPSPARREAAGGFALQRTRRGGGAKPQWLLVERHDNKARPGYDVVAERPESVASGKTLEELLSEG